MLIESADRVEVFASGEKKRASAEIERKINPAKRLDEDAAPERDDAVSEYARAAAGATGTQCGDCIDNVPGADTRVGINEEQNFASRGTGAGIARGRNLAPVDRHYLHISLFCDLRGRIR